MYEQTKQNILDLPGTISDTDRNFKKVQGLLPSANISLDDKASWNAEEMQKLWQAYRTVRHYFGQVQVPLPLYVPVGVQEIGPRESRQRGSRFGINEPFVTLLIEYCFYTLTWIPVDVANMILVDIQPDDYEDVHRELGQFCKVSCAVVAL